MSLLVRSTSCRTSENRSYRWIAVVTIVAMLGFAGFAFATVGNHQGAKLAPISKDTKAAKASASILTADGAPQAPANNTVHQGNSPQAIPSNDDCGGAIVIPSGSLPVVTAPVDITEATPTGSVNGEGDEGILTCATIENTIWYSFTPTTSGMYTFATCPTLAPANNLADTVIGVLDSTAGTCPSAAQLGCNDTGACHGASDDTSIASAVLTAGNTYFVVVGHWAGSATVANDPIGPGNNTISLQVNLSPAPTNDTCGAGGANATPIFLNRVTEGTTAGANNDYRADSSAACFSGVGQTGSSGAGLDVVFKFTPPADGKYSFRYVQDDSAAALRGQNPVLYLSHTCPASAPNGPVVTCNPLIGDKGANRITCTPPCSPNTATNGNRSEEIDCTQLNVADGPAYVYFDDRAAGNAGGPMAIEVTQCHPETEPNDDPATANVYPGCFATGAANTAADVDFFYLGTPPAGAKIFAGIDSVAVNALDFELRITNTTDTLGYDDNDGTSQIGLNAPIVAGVFADGNPIYARVNKGSLATELVPAAPYHLYSRIETGVAQNEVDTPSNASYYYGNLVTGGGFVKGIHATSVDQDCYRFVAHEGDNIALFSDNNPNRVPGTIVNTWPILRDLTLLPPTATRFTGQVTRNLLTPSPGTLTGVTPSVVSEFWDYRARYTGTYMACYYPETPGTSGAPPATAFPLPYQGSISLNCGPVPDPTTFVADVSVTKTVPAGPINTGATVDYTITLTNNSATDIAVDTDLVDTLPPEVVFVGLTVNDGFGGNNVGCISLPTPGTADAPIDCTVFSIAPGASVTYTLSVKVANCIGAGIDISNTASITSYTTDPNASNNSASVTFTTSEDGTCSEPLCDATECVTSVCSAGICDASGFCDLSNNRSACDDTNPCTTSDQCSTGVCVGGPAPNCDDNNLCTDDSCNPFAPDPASPCVNDSSLLGDLCNDGNACTGDGCDPLLFCVFPNLAAGTVCDDFLNCTTPDQCDGQGICAGRSVCDDGLPCTDDYGDEGNSCACTNSVSFAGTLCSDNSVCTTGDVCDGLGGTIASCIGAALNCDDGNPCTDDSCDTATGCVHTNNTSACNDGDACTTGDTCGGGVCTPGAPLVCNDSNACTTDSCNSATGCVYLNNTNACNDGNACTVSDTCSGGACAGTAIVCNDANACTTDTCNSATGCVYTNNTAACNDGNACTTGDTCSGGHCVGGSPVVCTASDQCHSAGVCNPGTGVCSNPNKPNGTVCNDQSLCTTGETCQSGTCTPAHSGLNHPRPKSAGYYEQLCDRRSHGHWPYHGDQLTNADALCVASLTDTFDYFTTVDDLCNVLDDDHHGGGHHGGRHHGDCGWGSDGKDCDKAENELIATALNICRARVCEEQDLDSRCSGNNNTTVAQSFAEADAILDNASRTRTTCKKARCELREINNGHALEMNSLHLVMENNKIRLMWEAPVLDDGTGSPNNYELWRRPLGSEDAFTKIGQTTGLTFLDQTSGTALWEYDVTADIP